MSEHLTPDYEQLITPEQDAERHDKLAEVHETPHEAHNTHADRIEQIRNTIEREASSKEKTDNQLKHEQHDLHRPHHYVTKKIKSDQYKKTIKEVQRDLSPAQRRFSKLVHQPVVEQISEVGAKTIARPTGIIGGALVALIGSGIVMYMARHIGFEVPVSIYALLFVVGFVLGLCIEVLVHVLRRSKTRNRAADSY